MRRRWKRRLVWAAVLGALALLAIPATVAQAAAALDSRRRLLMRKLVLPVLVAGAAAVVVAGGTLASASATVSRTLVLVASDLPKSELYVDAGRKGEGPGDTMFFREALRRGGARIGETEVMCVFVGPGKGRCHGTLTLPEGTLEAAGGIRFDGTFSVPVVGGTGEYAGARGVVRVTAVDDSRSRYSISLVD